MSGVLSMLQAQTRKAENEGYRPTHVILNSQDGAEIGYELLGIHQIPSRIEGLRVVTWPDCWALFGVMEPERGTAIVCRFDSEALS